MASILKHLRSSTADKRPVASGLAEGQFAINTASGTPAVFFKDSNGGVVKVGPAHVGASAPNAVPAGSAGNSLGELWVDDSLTTPGLNYYTGSAFVNLTPSGTTAAVGLVELATPAETQTGTDGVRAVTPSGLQSKVSDSTSTTSSTTIASSTAVKSAYDLANAALPKAGGTVTGELLIGTTGSLVFEGSSDDSFETTIAVTNPTADHTITFPNVTGTVVTTGDTGTVTSTMIANDTIVNADINSAAAIVDTKLATISTADKVSVSALNIDGATDIGGALENGDLFIVDDGAGGTNRKTPAFRMSQLTYSGVTGDITIASGGTSAISAGVIVNDDVNASAAIAGTKISPDFGSQTITTTGVVSAALGAAATPSITFTGDLNTGIYSPGADQVAVATNGTGRLFVDASGNVGVGATPAVRLHVSALDGTIYQQATRGTGTIWRIQTSGANGQAHELYDITNSQRAYLYTGGTGGSWQFSTEGAERLRITSTGALNFVGAGTAGSTQAVSFNGSAPVNSLVIDSSGRVGIGTSSPATLLHIAASGDPELRIEATGTAVSDDARLVLKTTNGEFLIQNDRSLGTSGVLTFNGAATDNLCIDHATGRVGIGTTSPATTLHVEGADNSTIAYFDTELGGRGLKINTFVSGAAASAGVEFEAPAGANKSAFAFKGATEFMRIDTAGRLLVGTSSARSAFGITSNIQSEGTGYDSGSINLVVNNNSNIGISPYINLCRSRGTANGSNSVVQSNDSLGAIAWCGADGSNLTSAAASIRAFVDGTPGAGDMPGRLVFSTTADGASSPTERMTIDSAGNVGIGRDPTQVLDIYRASGAVVALVDSDSLANAQSAAFTANGGARTAGVGVYKHAGITNPCGYIELKTEDNGANYLWVDNSDQFRISATVTHIGTTSGTVVGTQTSDERLKNILGPVEYGLDTLKQIEPVRYALKTEPDTEKLGFIAQQVLPLVPQSVFDTGEEIEEGEPTKLGMEYVALIPVLVNAIKELSDKNDALEARLAVLESQP